MNGSTKIELTFSEKKMIWQLLTTEAGRIKEKIEASPKPLDYWVEQLEDTNKLLKRIDFALRPEKLGE